ncbi:unnamed protein product [Cylicocyclus nassatus]|uniref:Sodium/calcium exchanger membrane region domain-containing protein n=1 Tax=Cylicocyclus nassatus TaxID=53992 RepID=A0AA36GT53_CYLNA|nr:unnamed protein product [Cylicocyclus nassatus]
MTKKKFMAVNGDLLNVAAPKSTYVKPEEEIENPEESEEEFVVSHNVVLKGPEARKMTVSQAPPPIKTVSTLTVFHDVIKHINPLPEEWNELGMFGKMLSIIKIPAILLLKVTIPLTDCSWSKAMAIIQALFAPQWFLFAFGMTTLQPFNGSPGLYAYALILSAIIIVLLAIFTSIDKQPRYYKEFASYLGFVMALSWIYIISSEVVSVVTMIGVISQLSHEILGLTVMAWSNSIGDLVADISVVKQGYPRMAMAASIGGPLFNFLIGFGLPFLIAVADGRTVTVNLNPTYRVLILFLCISLTTTLIACFVQHFYLRRPHARRMFLYGIDLYD